MLQAVLARREAEVDPVYWVMDKVSNANNKITIPANWLDIPEIGAALRQHFNVTGPNYRNVLDR